MNIVGLSSYFPEVDTYAFSVSVKLTCSRRRTIRRPKAETLIKLLHRKRELEVSIDRCQHDLAQAYGSAARQLQIALDGRVGELSG